MQALLLSCAEGEEKRGMGHLLGGLAIAVSLGALAGCGPSGGGTATQAPPAALSSTDKALLAELPAPYRTADLDNGRLHFNLCRACHTIIQGAPNMTGPNLYGVFGRKVASVPDYGYSAALKSKAWVWDASHLNGWLKDPQSYVPGTKMGFYGLHNDQDRIDTIAYLKVASSGGGI
jgi:cytochrome c